MKKKLLVLLIGVFVFTGPAGAGPQQPQEGVVELKGKDIKTAVVRIRGYEGVAPLNLFIEPGTVVVWLNQYKGEVKVTFPQKKVTLACKSPVNFSINDEGVFVSKDIPFGAVASLCFVERGTFEYFIERTPMSTTWRKSDHFRFEGKIVVK